MERIGTGVLLIVTGIGLIVVSGALCVLTYRDFTREVVAPLVWLDLLVLTFALVASVFGLVSVLSGTIAIREGRP